MKYKINYSSKNKYNSRIYNKRNPFSARSFKVNNMLNKKTRYGQRKKGRLDKSKFRKKFSKFISTVIGIGFFLFVIFLIWVGSFLQEVNNSLPEPGKLIERRQVESSIIYDRNGEELYKINDGKQNRIYTKLEDYPPHLVVAVLAAEDKDFYEHKGLDWFGIMRCSYLSARYYVTKKGSVCGASTISQQIVRNTLMFDAFGDKAYDRSTFLSTAERKVREMLMTMQVEKTLSKEELLEMYMNEVNLGGMNYGFEAGSQAIFGKSAKELTIEESALLAGIIRSPSAYNPIIGSTPEMAVVNKDRVLDLMLKHKDNFTKHVDLGELEITSELIEEAKTKEIAYNPGRMNIKAPHFVFYVKDELVKMYDLETVERGGLRIYTTLDYEAQKIAEDTLKRGIEQKGKRHNVNNGAMVAINPPTGEIITMVGSVDYWNTTDKRVDGNVNVTTALRQMGSSFKPFTYLTAITQGYSTGMPAHDIEDYKFGAYRPSNWDYRFNGPMLMREALVKSRNISAVSAIQLVGIDQTIQVAERLGITTLTDKSKYGLSLTLGAAEEKLLEHTYAFSVFAMEGRKAPLTSILKVEDSRGKVIYEKPAVEADRVFDEKEIYLLNWIMCDAGGFGDQLGNSVFINKGKRFACGKGGTTNGPKDLTGFMYHKNLAVGIWVGNNNNEIFPGAFSSTVPLPIASEFMKNSTILAKYPSALFNRPAGVVTGTACRDTGLLAAPENPCPKDTIVYIQGKAPAYDPRKVVTVCKSNGLIPTNLELARKYDLTVDRQVFENFTFVSPNQDGAFKSYFSRDPYNYLFAMPGTGECALPEGVSNLIIEITKPANGSAYDSGGKINFESYALATGGVNYVEYRFGGSSISSRISTAPFSFEWTIPASLSTGTYTVTARMVSNTGEQKESTVSLNITNPTPTPVITITTPASGTSKSIATGFPINITASMAPASSTITAMTFTITGTDPANSSYTKTIVDSNSADGWSVNWAKDVSVVVGNYRIRATASTATESSVNIILTE